MSGQTSFGRRGLGERRVGAPAQSPSSADVALTPEQRAYLFGADTPADKENFGIAPTGEVPRWSRLAAFMACSVAACFVVVFTVVGRHHGAAGGSDAGVAKRLLGGSARWLEPASMLWTIVSVSSQLATNLWLTNKFCTRMRMGGIGTFAMAGAWIGAGLAFLTQLVGLGAPDMSYLLLAASGAGAAALYRLLAGRR